MAEKYEAFAAIFQIWKQVSDAAKADREKYLSLTKKDDDVVKEALSNTDNADVVAYNDFVKKVDEKIAELKAKKDEAKANLRKKVLGEEKQASKEEVEATKAAFIEKRAQFRATKDNVLLLLGKDEAALKAGMSAYGIEDLNNLGGGTSKGAGEIVRKRLASATWNGEDVADSNGKVTFTTLSTKSGVPADALRNAAASAANVSSVRDIPNGQTVEFTVTHDEKEHTFTITTPEEKSEK